MADCIIVGYRTEPVPESILKTLMPDDFKPRANLKDKLKIEADLQEKRDRFLADAGTQPYTGRLAEVVISTPAQRFTWQWVAKDDDQEPLCVGVRNHLLEHYPNAWSNSLADRGTPRAVFVGFNIRRFLKMLSAECALPEHRLPLPLRMWYDNRDHRDVAAVLVPDGFSSLTMSTALKRLRPAKGASQESWDATFEGWTGPHVSPLKDVKASLEIGVRFGLFAD